MVQDVALVLPALAARGVRLHAAEQTAGGQSGTAYLVRVEESDEELIFKFAHHDWVETMAQATLVSALTERGYPAPSRWQPYRAGEPIVIIQQPLPGASCGSIDHDFLDQVMHLNELQKDIGSIEAFVTFREGGPAHHADDRMASLGRIRLTIEPMRVVD